MARYMPAFDAYLHYRIIDVSTLKELAKRWRPDVVQSFTKEGKHEALADVYESIEELRHYRKHFLVTQAPDAASSRAPSRARATARFHSARRACASSLDIAGSKTRSRAHRRAISSSSRHTPVASPAR